MGSRDRSPGVPWKPDPDTALWIAWITAGLFFLLFVVSAVGEILGWWGLIGEIGMGIGGLVGVLVTIASLLYGAGSGQVQNVGDEVENVGEDVRSNGRSLEAIEEGIVGDGGMVEGLDGLAKALGGEEGVLGELDVVQVELDRQTGVLDRQARILGQIRDRL